MIISDREKEIKKEKQIEIDVEEEYRKIENFKKGIKTEVNLNNNRKFDILSSERPKKCLIQFLPDWKFL